MRRGLRLQPLREGIVVAAGRCGHQMLAVLSGQGGQLGLQQHGIQRMRRNTASAASGSRISGQKLAQILLVEARVEKTRVGVAATPTRVH